MKAITVQNLKNCDFMTEMMDGNFYGPNRIWVYFTNGNPYVYRIYPDSTSDKLYPKSIDELRQLTQSN